MATSGTFTGARGGTSTGPYLRLTWSLNSQDVANNRSSVHLKLELVTDYQINFSSSKTGVLQGTSYTYSGGMNTTGAGSVTVKELDVYVNHNSDGTLTTTFSGNLALNITWSGYGTGTISVSGSATLPTIARASTFTISGNTLGSPITVNINRADSSFTHTIYYDLPVGSNRAGWTNVATQQVFTPALSDAQYITNATSITANISVQTYSGSTFIGATSQQFTMYVPSSVVPTASGLTVSIAGTGRDSTLGLYIQNFSKVTASFTSAGIYGSTITSSTIEVKRQSDNGNIQTISGSSGTTVNPVALSGTYIITATATDSRGRTATVSTTITVTAYSPPTITTFSVARESGTTSNVDATINTSWSMGANNPTNVTVVGVDNSNVSTTEYTLNGSTSGSLSVTQTYTSQSDASSYTYTLTVTDSFGNVANATATIGTSFVEFTIAKGSGIGVGKVWERGALDVGGDAHVSGNLLVGEQNLASVKTGTLPSTAGSWIRFAQTPINVKNAMGIFKITGAVANYHSQSIITATTQYESHPSINVVNHSEYNYSQDANSVATSGPAFSEVRIVFATNGYTNNYAYIEAYVPYANGGGGVITVEMLAGDSWQLIDMVSGSIPTNYDSYGAVLNLGGGVLWVNNEDHPIADANQLRGMFTTVRPQNGMTNQAASYAAILNIPVKTASDFQFASRYDGTNGLYFRGSHDVGAVWNAWEQVATIVQSGSNANGTYIRYSDGTQICYMNWGSWSPSGGFTSIASAGSTYYYHSWTWTFPAAFSAAPACFNSGDLAGAGIEAHNCFSASTTGCTVEDGGLGFNGAINSQTFAIGKWR